MWIFSWTRDGLHSKKVGVRLSCILYVGFTGGDGDELSYCGLWETKWPLEESICSPKPKDGRSLVMGISEGPTRALPMRESLDDEKIYHERLCLFPILSLLVLPWRDQKPSVACGCVGSSGKDERDWRSSNPALVLPLALVLGRREGTPEQIMCVIITGDWAFKLSDGDCVA